MNTTSTRPSNEDINKILNMFDKKVLKLNRSELFDEKTLSSHLKSNARYDDQFTTCEHAIYFINHLRRAFSQLPKSSIEIDNRDIGYQFPNKEQINSCRLLNNIIDPASFVNESEVTIRNSIYGHFAEPNDQNKLSVITGKVGSGKSAFIQYLDTCYSDKLVQKKKTITTVHKYTHGEEKKLGGYANWAEYFSEQVLNKLVNRIINRYFNIIKESFPDYEASFLDDLTDNLYIHKEYNEDEIAKLTGKVERLFEIKNKGKKISSQAIESVDGGIKQFFLNHLKENGYTFLVILDGYDTFSLEELVIHKQRNMLKGIGDLVSGKLNSALLKDLDPRYLITLRSCTYDYYHDWPTETGYKVNRVRLCPAGVSKILNSKITYFGLDADCTSDEVNALNTFIVHVINTVKLHLKIEKDEELVSIFNENYRACLNYMFDIIIYFLNSIIYNEGEPPNVSELMKCFGDRNHIEKYVTTHILTEILLLSTQNRFNNYYKLAQDAGDDKGKAEPRKGYIDNLYNYDNIKYSDDVLLPAFLLKIRIVQILTYEGVHLTIESIIDKLNIIGYAYPEDAIDRTIDLLIKVGFVRPRTDKEGKLKYAVTEKAKFIIERTVGELRYVEHIVQVTRYPKKVCNLLIHADKYDHDDCHWNNARAGWVFASVVNNFIHYQYISYLEQIERQISYDQGFQHYEIGRGRWSLMNAVTHVKTAVHNILSSPISAADDTYLDTILLLSKLHEVEDVLLKNTIESKKKHNKTPTS